MSLRTSLGAPVRTGYCTNVAPAPSPAALRRDLAGLWSDVRDAASLDRLGLGLWFPRDVGAALARDATELAALREALDAARLDLVTINAFPADAFHAPIVKEAVYRPDWTTDERAEYTLHAARIAAALVPEGDVPISTLPIGYPKLERSALRRAAGRLVGVALALDRIRGETGTTIRLALEPEPCCALERTDEALAFFREHLAPAMEVAAGAQRAGPSDAGEMLRRHLGVCLDLCHASVEHEDPVAAFGRYEEAGIPVHKVQVSAALEVPNPSDAAQRKLLEAFVEDRWLHQVGRSAGDVVLDLPAALAAPPQGAPWRVHYHVPLHRNEVGGLPTTRATVERFLTWIAAHPTPPVLELETYTWSVVPDASENLAANVAAEVRWANDVLLAAGCTEVEE